MGKWIFRRYHSYSCSKYYLLYTKGYIKLYYIVIGINRHKPSTSITSWQAEGAVTVNHSRTTSSGYCYSFSNNLHSLRNAVSFHLILISVLNTWHLFCNEIPLLAPRNAQHIRQSQQYICFTLNMPHVSAWGCCCVLVFPNSRS